MLQAEAWLHGRLDIGVNYEHLELAVYSGKYYVSFPPFLSILLLPFALINMLPFISINPDHFIALVMACLSGVFAYKLALVYIKNQEKAAFYSLFLCVGGNYLFLTNTGYVWFIAQNAAFMFTLMSLYYAARDDGERKPALSLFFLCCVMGCRPFNGIYLPIILYLLYAAERDAGFIIYLKRLLIWALPAVGLGMVYMGLNYARFGNVLEFGHTYLPEFTEAVHGQFSPVYLAQNIGRLFRLPGLRNGRIAFQAFDGTAFWLVSPIVLTYVITYIIGIKRLGKDILTRLIPVLLAAHLLILCLHKTMGGWHFGNRYTVDILPALFFGLARQDKGPERTWMFVSLPLLALGFGLNIIGTVLLFLGYL
jgi:hypothetical protein